MGNFKKISAAVVAGAIMLTSVVPAFAATYTPVNGDKAAVLNQLELYAGTSSSTFVPSLETELTRGQGATLLTKLFNMDNAAQALTDAEADAILKDFADADKVPTYAKKRLAYLVKNGIMSGSKNTTTGDVFVNADESLLGGQFATLILKQLGYTVASWSDSVDQLSEVDGAKDIANYLAYAAKELLRDQAVGLMFGSLTSEYSDGKATIIDKIVEAKPSLRAVAESAGLIAAPTTLAVESVTSSNLREVFVKFNKAVDETSAETVANYMSSTDVAAYIDGAPVLQADGRTVKLTIKDGTLNQTTLDFAIKNVKDTNGVVLGSTYTKSITLFDAEVPSALSYKFTGPQNIEITFSEPIDATASALSVLVDNGIYGATATVKSGSENVVDVELGAALTEGAHTLVVKGAKDFAHYTSLDKTFEITYVKDTTAPTVSVNATQTEVTFTFNKPVTGLSTANIYHTYSSYKPYALVDTDGNAVAADKYYDKVVAKFVDPNNSANKLPLPAGTATKVVLIKEATTGVLVQDRYGNAIPEDMTFTVTVSADTTAPSISNVTVDSEHKIIISYSEAVSGYYDAANFVVKKSDGTVISNSEYSVGQLIEDSVYKTVLSFNKDLAGGAYSVEVSNVKDTSLNENAMGTKTATFVVTDLTPVSEASYILSDDGKTLYVTFPETMSTSGASSILNQSNYLYGTSASDAVALTDASITVFGTADKAKIVLPWDFTGKNLYVKNVADTAGNVMTAMFVAATPVVNAAPEITAVKTVALNKLELTVDKHLSSLNASNIIVDGTAAASASFVNGTDADTGLPISTITVTLKAANVYATGDLTPSTIEITGTDIKSITGKSMVANANILSTVTATDGVAPVVAKVEYVNTQTIRVIFDEAINPDSWTGIGKNGFSIVGGTLNSVAFDGNKTVTLTGTNFTKYTDVVYTAGNLCDNTANNNAVASFSFTNTLTVAP
jgi:methionine-rich copper-binding protein CopC